MTTQKAIAGGAAALGSGSILGLVSQFAYIFLRAVFPEQIGHANPDEMAEMQQIGSMLGAALATGFARLLYMGARPLFRVGPGGSENDSPTA